MEGHHHSGTMSLDSETTQLFLNSADNRKADILRATSFRSREGVPLSCLREYVNLMEAALTERRNLGPSVKTALCGLIAALHLPLIYDATTRTDARAEELLRLASLLLELSVPIGGGENDSIVTAAIGGVASLLAAKKKGRDYTPYFCTQPASQLLVRLFSTHAALKHPSSRDALEIVKELCGASKQQARLLVEAGLLGHLLAALTSSISMYASGVGSEMLLALALQPGSDGVSSDFDAHEGEARAIPWDAELDSEIQAALVQTLLRLGGRAVGKGGSMTLRNNALAMLLLLQQQQQPVSSHSDFSHIIPELERICMTAGSIGVVAHATGGSAAVQQLDCDAVLLAWHVMAAMVEMELTRDDNADTSEEDVVDKGSALYTCVLCLSEHGRDFLDVEAALRPCWSGVGIGPSRSSPSLLTSAGSSIHRWSPNQWQRLTYEAVPLLSRLAAVSPELSLQCGVVELGCELAKRAILRIDSPSVTHYTGIYTQPQDTSTLTDVLHLLTVLCEATSSGTGSTRRGPASQSQMVVPCSRAECRKPVGMQADAVAELVQQVRQDLRDQDVEYALSWDQATSTPSAAAPPHAADSAAIHVVDAKMIPVLVALVQKYGAKACAPLAAAASANELTTAPHSSSRTSAFGGSTSGRRTSSFHQVDGPLFSNSSSGSGALSTAEESSAVWQAALLLLSKLDDEGRFIFDELQDVTSSTSQIRFAAADFRECGGIGCVTECLSFVLSAPAAPSSSSSHTHTLTSKLPRHAGALLAAIGVARALILPDPDSLEEFAAQGGVALLWDCISVTSGMSHLDAQIRDVQCATLSLLCDLQYLHPVVLDAAASQWRSLTGNHGVEEVLLVSWRTAAALPSHSMSLASVDSCLEHALHTWRCRIHAALCVFVPQPTLTSDSALEALWRQVHKFPSVNEGKVWRDVQDRLSHSLVCVTPDDVALMEARAHE